MNTTLTPFLPPVEYIIMLKTYRASYMLYSELKADILMCVTDKDNKNIANTLHKADAQQWVRKCVYP